MYKIYQCNGLTVKNKRCLNKIKIYDNESAYCNYHIDQKTAQNNDNILDNNEDRNNEDKLIKNYLLSILPAEFIEDFKDCTVEYITSLMFPDINNNGNNDQDVDNKILNNIASNSTNVLETDINKLENVNIFDCECCFCEKFIDDMIKCSEGHKFCKNCLNKYLTNQLTSGNYELKCMASYTCGGIYTKNTLEKTIDDKLLKNYQDNETKNIINKSGLSDIYTCPKCMIYSVIMDKDYRENQKEPKFICENNECKHISCYVCKNDFHGKVKCNYLLNSQDIRKTIEEILTNNRTRKCPNCSKEFIRTDGCSKIICKCNVISCYVCKIEINGYAHFRDNLSTSKHKSNKCPLWISEEEIEYLSFINTLNEIYDLYSHDTNKLKNEVYPVLIILEKKYEKLINEKLMTN